MGTVLSVVPVVAAWAIVRRLNKPVPTPNGLLIWLFLWGGAVATAVAGIVNTTSALFVGEVGAAVLSAPLIEETMKYLAVIAVASTTGAVDNKLSGLVAGLTVGAGFTFIEDVTYVLGATNDGEAAATAVSRIVVMPFFHMASTALAGWFLGSRIAARRPVQGAHLTFLFPSIALHAAWNSMATFLPLLSSLVGFVVTGALIALSEKVYQETLKEFTIGLRMLDELGFTEPGDRELLEQSDQSGRRSGEFLDLKRAITLAALEVRSTGAVRRTTLDELLHARIAHMQTWQAR